MKNEIGRKLTSLTIMAIMFAGGMTIAAPSFMPGAYADFSVTNGELSVSSEFIQGAAILEIVVNDPDIADIETDINSGATVSIGGTSYDMSQGVNGKWYLYVVDSSISQLMDADDNGMEFGVLCQSGMGIAESSSDIIIDTSTDVWVAVKDLQATAAGSDGGCLDADGMTGVLDDTAGSTSRQDLTAAVLQDAPTLSNHDEKTAGQSGIDLGQRGHGLNESGYGSWPYILAIELNDDNIIEYGSDDINVEFGNTDDESSIEIINTNPSAHAELHVIVTDPALNIDPTTADVWIFDVGGETGHNNVIFNNNATSSTNNNLFTLAELGQMQCADNCYLTNSSGTAKDVFSGLDTVTMTESSENSGIFESFDLNGESQIEVVAQAAADTAVILTYGGEVQDVIITYHDASIEMDAGAGTWMPTQQAAVTINDPDANQNPSEQDELEIGDETDAIPTIVMGSPLTLAGGTNSNLQSDDDNLANGGHSPSINVGDDQGAKTYGVNVYNTTDTSERLRILHNGTESSASATHTVTWINVTTGHTRQNIMDLAGTVVLSYDISGPAGLVSSEGVSVYLGDDGNNGTDNLALTLVDSGNADVGVVDLDDGTISILNPSVGTSKWNSINAASNYLSIHFKMTHAAGADLATSADYAIAADFCNFDQNNGSGVAHNCIYRMEAEETGDNTGIFTGNVEYITLHNSTSQGSTSGEHDGNDFEVEGLLSDVNSEQDLIVVVQDSVDGTDAIRVQYNDTDALQSSEVVGAQLDTSTFTGTVDLDQDTYEADDMATITIVDPDLNQDSEIRDTYQNSSTTFLIKTTDSSGIAVESVSGTSQTIIETTVDSGIFVGTFSVPDKNGQDLEITYYEARDAGGNAVEYYDIATVTSNSGEVSFDRSVYPVPFASGELKDGDDSGTATKDGNVTITVTVTDADFTDDTLTTTSTTSAGSIEIMLIEGTTTSTCYTAGSGGGSYDGSGAKLQELGPLTEVADETSTYEVEFTLDKVNHCGSGAATVTVSSGDVIQVKYVDASDDGGSSSNNYDSSTFDLRTGSLSVDKDVYVLGSDMVVTLTDPDLNLDSGTTETYDLEMIEWDSDACSGGSSCLLDGSDFTNNPSDIQETGDDTGVFQTVTTIPEDTLNSTTIDFGEEVVLTYADQGLSGEDQVGDDSSDIETYFSISNFGALVELDKAVYSWTDVVFFEITAPDHNTNTAAEESIGTSALPIQVTTRSGKLCSSGDKTYFADETGPDTGVFDGEIELAGFAHTMSSDSSNRSPSATSCGSTNDGGVLRTDSQTDGISVSYEYNDGSVVVASASIVWNIGEASFDSSAVSAGGSGIVTVVDQDENLDDDVIDTFTVDIFSDSDNGGFNLDMHETGEDTGVFEGTVHFTSDLATSGSSLRVSEGDTVTAEYTDETLPEPYTTDDDLTIAATTTVGTAFPPLERAPAANARVVDAFGASVAEVTVDQQVQIAADVSNGQSGDQAFAYLVQVQDGNGVTVSLAWITGSLNAGQSMSPALSWTPDASGSYTATVFVWESVDNPTALSPTVSVDIDVV